MHRSLSPVEAYCEAHTSPLSPLLAGLERETHLRTLYPQMLSGPAQGMRLQLFSRLLRPLRALELGTFTGYGSICLAQGLAPDGVLHTVEANDEVVPLARRWLGRAGLEGRVRLHVGDAAAVVPALDDVFDLVFLDAGKLRYREHYELVLPRLRPGGLLLADNMLWENKVLDPGTTDAAARALRAFADAVQADERVDNALLPVGDGLLVACKR
jgi:caffeoyl-CoA O-methyltransferase